MPTNRPVSAVLITRNEEKNLPRSLKSVTWADEILVVDAESTDRTQKICLDPNQPWAGKIRFLSRPWTGFKDQRTFAMNEAQNDWLLVLDADEECSPELASKIKNLLGQEKSPQITAFKIRRVEYFLGKQIHYGIWNPSYQDRFFYRKGVKYTNDIHEYPVFPTPPSLLHEPLHHFPEFSPERFLEKMNRYTTIEAKDRIRQGQKTNLFRLIFAFPAMFLKNYFYYGAYKDGVSGVIISLLEGISRTVRHVKIWQYSQNPSKEGRSHT